MGRLLQGIRMLCSKEFHEFYIQYIDYNKQNDIQELFQMMERYSGLETEYAQDRRELQEAYRQLQQCQHEIGQLTALMADLQKQATFMLSAQRQIALISGMQEQIAQLQKQVEKLQMLSAKPPAQASIKPPAQVSIKPPAQASARPASTGSPFRITKNRDRYFATQENMEQAVSKIADTAILERFFSGIPDDNSFKKMYQRYSRNLKKGIGKLDEEDEIEDVLNTLVGILQDGLVRKLMVAVYRGMKNGGGEFERKLLVALNQYLEAAGFYCRDDIHVGGILCDKDYADMEFIKDDRALGRRHGEITEIETYPYYINFIDEDGAKRCVHTQGMMIVTA